MLFHLMHQHFATHVVPFLFTQLSFVHEYRCMNIGSVFYRLPVQGTYRSINYEYKWVLRGCARTPHPDSNTEQQVCQTILRAQLLL